MIIGFVERGWTSRPRRRRQVLGLTLVVWRRKQRHAVRVSSMRAPVDLQNGEGRVGREQELAFVTDLRAIFLWAVGWWGKGSVAAQRLRAGTVRLAKHEKVHVRALAVAVEAYRPKHRVGVDRRAVIEHELTRRCLLEGGCQVHPSAKALRKLLPTV